MRRIGLIGGLVVAAGGLVWLLQGLNVAFAPKSFMTGDRTWVFIGAVTLVAGLAIAAWSLRRPPAER